MESKRTRSPSSRQELYKYPKKRRRFWVHIIVIAVLLFAVLPLLLEVSRNNAALRDSKEALAIMLEEEQRINIENEQLRRYAEGENFDEFIERHARESMGYANPRERVFHVVPGN